MSIENNNIKFWCPASIEKAIDEATGTEIMRLGGIASTMDKDSDEEFLDPNGFDVKPLLASGTVNWHHQAKGAPATIIGEPTKAEIRPEGLYIETDLYPSSKIAVDVYNLAQTFATDSKTRRLGYSIEGKVIKRKSNDKKSPDYKIIQKAIITGVAITHQPKNAQTFADIIKGGYADNSEEIEDDENNEESSEEKALDCETGAPLKKESLNPDLKKTAVFSKGETLLKIRKDYPSITIEKANKIYPLILKIHNMKDNSSKNVVVTDEDIEKAYSLLGLESLSKAEGSESEAEETSEETTEMAEEAAEKKEEKTEKKEEKTEKAIENDIEKAEETSEIEKAALLPEERFDRIEKAIGSSHLGIANFIKAAAVIIKECSQKLDESRIREDDLLSIVKAQDETISSFGVKLEEFGNSTPAPKSLRNSAPVERTFQKAGDGDFSEKGQENGEQVFSMKRNRAAVSDLLDQATFHKGYDEEFSKACTHFETSKNLPADIIARVRREFGIKIVE